LVNPEDYEWTIEEIREKFSLLPEDKIEEYGYEKTFSEEIKNQLKQDYTFPSLCVRLRPDYKVTRSDGVIFYVEAKRSSKYLEASQLFINKWLMDGTVYYLFPDEIVDAEYIPFEKVFIPPRYKSEFYGDMALRMKQFVSELEFADVPENSGSGDPYIHFRVGK
jgi:hypothetical protein